MSLESEWPIDPVDVTIMKSEGGEAGKQGGAMASSIEDITSGHYI